MGGRFSSKQKQIEYEMVILDRIGKLEQALAQIAENQSRPSAFTGILPGLLSASSSVNGTVKGGDVVVSGLMCVVGIGAGGVTAGTLWLSGAEWINPSLPLWAGTVIGFSVCSLRLLYDGILYELIQAFQRESKEEKEEKSQSPPVSRPYPVYSVQNPPPDPAVMQELPNGRTIAWSDLVNFLRTATANYDRYGTKAWAREAWARDKKDDYPQFGYLPGRVWAGVRQLCYDFAKKFPAYQDNRGESLIWQTNDIHLIEQFIDDLENDDDD